jgi:hypothetical protein
MVLENRLVYFIFQRSIKAALADLQQAEVVTLPCCNGSSRLNGWHDSAAQSISVLPVQEFSAASELLCSSDSRRTAA